MRRRTAFVLGLSLACRLAAGADGPPVGEDVRVQQALRLLEAWADGQQDYERLPPAEEAQAPAQGPDIPD